MSWELTSSLSSWCHEIAERIVQHNGWSQDFRLFLAITWSDHAARRHGSSDALHTYFQSSYTSSSCGVLVYVKHSNQIGTVVRDRVDSTRKTCILRVLKRVPVDLRSCHKRDKSSNRETFKQKAERERDETRGLARTNRSHWKSRDEVRWDSKKSEKDTEKCPHDDSAGDCHFVRNGMTIFRLLFGLCQWGVKWYHPV